MDPGMELLTTLGEVGGITGMMLAVVAFAIRLAKKNGCRMKCYNCNGQPLAEVDVEEGGAQLDLHTDLPPPQPSNPHSARPPVRPVDIEME
jgi:hypothetical protein